MGVVTTGTGIDFDGVRVDTLPPLDFLFSMDDGKQDGSDSDPIVGQTFDHLQDMARLTSALEYHIRQTPLVLMKSSLVTAADPPPLCIKSSSISLETLVKVIGLKQLCYTTYDKEQSPGPPLDRNSKSKEMALQQAAMAAAVTAVPVPQITPILDPTAEALRKATKMAEMAKRVAALQERQKRDKE